MMALIGMQTFSSPVAMPDTYTFVLDPANLTTGLCLNLMNDKQVTCVLKVGLYAVTAATSGAFVNVNVSTTPLTCAHSVLGNAQALTAGLVVWSTGLHVIPAGSSLTVWNVATGTDTGTIATGLVAYAIIQLWPVSPII
jgi:hypothetical protein